MRIIFSRKGFDSSNGGFSSPIFPDGTCYSVPIPGKRNRKKYQELDFRYENEPIQAILNDLTRKSIKINGKRKSCDYFDDKFICHLDPLVMEDGENQYMTLGQVGSALGHLKNQNVQVGDIFLFYGFFREVEQTTIWRYKNNAKNLHLIFAYMKIDKIVNVNENLSAKYQFLKNHPHFDESFRKKYRENYIFLGQNFRMFDYDTKRVLTDLNNYKKTSRWKLPINFDFSNYISYIKSVKVIENNAYISHKGPGQEFVVNLDKMTKQKQKAFLNYLEILEVL